MIIIMNSILLLTGLMAMATSADTDMSREMALLQDMYNLKALLLLAKLQEWRDTQQVNANSLGIPTEGKKKLQPV